MMANSLRSADNKESKLGMSHYTGDATITDEVESRETVASCKLIVRKRDFQVVYLYAVIYLTYCAIWTAQTLESHFH